MAKPGSNGARAISRGAVDLDRARLTDDQVRELEEVHELKNGLRCQGCGRRIEVGFQFASIGLREQVPVIRMAACSRDDCGFAEDAKPGATYMELVEYVWLDELGPDAPAAAVIVARNAKRAEHDTSLDDG